MFTQVTLAWYNECDYVVGLRHNIITSENRKLIEEKPGFIKIQIGSEKQHCIRQAKHQYPDKALGKVVGVKVRWQKL